MIYWNEDKYNADNTKGWEATKSDDDSGNTYQIRLERHSLGVRIGGHKCLEASGSANGGIIGKTNKKFVWKMH